MQRLRDRHAGERGVLRAVPPSPSASGHSFLHDARKVANTLLNEVESAAVAWLQMWVFRHARSPRRYYASCGWRLHACMQSLRPRVIFPFQSPCLLSPAALVWVDTKFLFPLVGSDAFPRSASLLWARQIGTKATCSRLQDLTSLEATHREAGLTAEREQDPLSRVAWKYQSIRAGEIRLFVVWPIVVSTAKSVMFSVTESRVYEILFFS